MTRPVGEDLPDPARWQSRRGMALLLRGIVLIAPVAVCVAVSFVVTRVVPAPQATAARVLWLAAVVLACGLLAWPARRQLRRLLPLAALLELSILFPGEAPTRWRVAREAGSLRHLQFLASGVPNTEPVNAATTILALVASLARHDRVTRGHSDRVRVFTDMISAEMGLPRAARDRLRWAALIHDIGKLDVPAKLLRKAGKPTADEWGSLRLHPEVGARLAAPLAGWLGDYAAVVVEHHERFDGNGYPAGLRGEQISLGARIVGLADAFEVMTAARPYKRAFSRATALREVVACSGTHFDPDVVRALLAVSTPRLRRALGPASWIGQLPVVGTAPAGGLPAIASTVARGAGTVMLSGVASAVVVSGGGASMAAPSSSTHSAPPDVASVASRVGVAPRVAVASPNPVGAAPTPGLTSLQSSPPGEGAPTSSATRAPVPRSTGVASPKQVPQPEGAVAAVGNTVDDVVDAAGGTVSGVVNGAGGTVNSTVDGVGATVSGLLGGGPDATPSAPPPTPTKSGGLGGLLGKLLGG